MVVRDSWDIAGFGDLIFWLFISELRFVISQCHFFSIWIDLPYRLFLADAYGVVEYDGVLTLIYELNVLQHDLHDGL